MKKESLISSDFRTPRAGEAPQTPIVGTVAWAWGGSGDIRWRHCVIFYTATEVGLSSNVRRAGGRHIIVEEVLHLYSIVLGGKDNGSGAPR